MRSASREARSPVRPRETRQQHPRPEGRFSTMTYQVSRRCLLAGAAAAAGAVVASPALAACGSSAGKTTGPGTTGAEALRKALPKYLPSAAVKADIPSTPGANGAASDPAFLSYPATPVQTVTG